MCSYWRPRGGRTSRLPLCRILKRYPICHLIWLIEPVARHATGLGFDAVRGAKRNARNAPFRTGRSTVPDNGGYAGQGRQANWITPLPSGQEYRTSCMAFKDFCKRPITHPKSRRSAQKPPLVQCRSMCRTFCSMEMGWS